MDATENEVLFGDKFEGELQRDSATKLKTKNLFSELKQETPEGKQPFRQSALPVTSRGRGMVQEQDGFIM